MTHNLGWRSLAKLLTQAMRRRGTCFSEAKLFIAIKFPRTTVDLFAWQVANRFLHSNLPVVFTVADNRFISVDFVESSKSVIFSRETITSSFNDVTSLRWCRPWWQPHVEKWTAFNSTFTCHHYTLDFKPLCCRFQLCNVYRLRIGNRVIWTMFCSHSNIIPVNIIIKRRFIENLTSAVTVTIQHPGQIMGEITSRTTEGQNSSCDLWGSCVAIYHLFIGTLSTRIGTNDKWTVRSGLLLFHINDLLSGSLSGYRHN